MDVKNSAALAVFDLNLMLNARRYSVSFEDAQSAFGDEYAATYYATIGDLSFVLLDTNDGHWWNLSTLDCNAHEEIVREQVPSECLAAALLNSPLAKVLH